MFTLAAGVKRWSNLINLLNEKDCADMEIMIFAVTLINKTLAGIPDQDTFYDIVDALEEQGMDRIIKSFQSKQGIEKDLLKQLAIYEAVLKYEDGDDSGLPDDLIKVHIPKVRSPRKTSDSNRVTRRRSSRYSCHSSGPKGSVHSKVIDDLVPNWQNKILEQSLHVSSNISESGGSAFQTPGEHQDNEQQPSQHQQPQQQPVERDEGNNSMTGGGSSGDQDVQRRPHDFSNNSPRGQRASISSCSSADSYASTTSGASSLYSLTSSDETTAARPLSLLQPLKYTGRFTSRRSPVIDEIEMNSRNLRDCSESRLETKSPAIPINGNQYSNPAAPTITTRKIDRNWTPISNSSTITPHVEPIAGSSIGVKNIQQQIMNQSIAAHEARPVINRLDIRSPNHEINCGKKSPVHMRPLHINDLDFSDLKPDDDTDVLSVSSFETTCSTGSPMPPPPPPPVVGTGPPPPPPMPMIGGNSISSNNMMIGSCLSLNRMNSDDRSSNGLTASPSSRFTLSHIHHYRTANNSSPTPSLASTASNNSLENTRIAKNKKTVKLFWKEVKEEKSLLSRLKRKKTIWDEVKPVPIDLQKLEFLFESRSREVMNKVCVCLPMHLYLSSTQTLSPPHFPFLSLLLIIFFFFIFSSSFLNWLLNHGVSCTLLFSHNNDRKHRRERSRS